MVTVAVGMLPALPASPAFAGEAVSQARPDRAVTVDEWRVEPVMDTAMEEHAPEVAVWPRLAARHVVVELPADGSGGRLPASATVGGLPVRVIPVTRGAVADVLDPTTASPSEALVGATVEVPSRVRLRSLERATGVVEHGVVALRLARADGGTASSRVRVEVDYSAFRDGFGADWANRLRLATIRECALGPRGGDPVGGEPVGGEATEEPSGCGKPVFLPTRTDIVAGTVSAEVKLADGSSAPAHSDVLDAESGAVVLDLSVDSGETGTLVVLMSGPSGDGGDFTRTDLKASYTWQHGGSSGHFEWSYPIEVPQVPGGMVPSVSLDYNSGAVDGQTAGQNVQPTWAGEGWSYSPGYIERTYRPCFDDSANSPYWTSLNDDTVLCWRLNNAQIVLNGKATQIVLGDDGVWRLGDDEGEKVELLTGASNRDNNGEHWKVTTTDGTQYWFGRHYLPNGRGQTYSTAEVRVYANHSGEPCFSSSSLGSSACNQAYRWMLDYVVDRHGNEISLWYNSETNRAANTGTGSYQYRRAIRPVRIEYGTRVGDDPATTAPARILFTSGDRCLQDCYTSGGDPQVENWPDTPWDLQCSASPCTNNTSPSFFTAKRLAQIRTQVRDSGAWRTVDQYDLAHSFPSTGTALSPALWLSSITRTAYGADGSSKAFPSVTFTGERRSQRADLDPDANMADNRKWRVVRVDTETGGRIEVVYHGPQSGCEFGSPFPSPHSNGRRCFPRLYTNSYNQTGWSWWHLFTVSQIIERDLVGGSPEVVHAYSYSSTGSSTTVKWAHDDGAAVWGSSLPYRSWSDWRGWARVTVRTGTSSAGPRTQTDYLYFRGLHGDRANSSGDTRSVQVTDDIFGSNFSDSLWRAGRLLQVRTFDVSSGTPVELTRYRPTQVRTGTRTLSTSWAIPNEFRSYLTRENQFRTWDWNPDTGSWAIRDYLTYTWDDLARTTSVHDSRRDTCTRLTYADNTSKRLLEFVSREQVVTGSCTAAPVVPDDLLSDVRYFYDGKTTHGATPTVGDVTRTEVYGASGWFTESEDNYDQYGRVTSTGDGLGRTTTTQYLHTADGRLSGLHVTNPAGHVGTSVIDPHREVPLTYTDPNGGTTTGEYDAAGRLLRMWEPGHDTAGTPTAEYEYSVTKTAPSWVSTRTLGPNGNQISSYEIYDGLLRLRQVQETAPDGNRVISDTTYDHRGLEATSSLFYNDASGPRPTLVTFSDAAVDRQARLVYDGQGREVETQHWSAGSMKFRTVTDYGYRSVTVTPPAGGAVTAELTDDRGNVVARRVFHTADTSGPYDETTYIYDGLDRLVAVADPAGDAWAYEYDVVGRTVLTSDPDSGVTTTVYDNAHQVTEATGARGITLTYTYDQLGRRTAVREGSHAGPELAEWVYDTVALGALGSSTRYHDGLAYVSEITGYDEGYRPLSRSVTIPASAENGDLAGVYLQQMTYHADGSLATQSLPAVGGQPAETLVYTYTDQGLLDSMAGLEDYVAATTYRWDGAVAETLHGPAGKRVRQSWGYDEATGRAVASQVDTEDPQSPGSFLERFATTLTYDDVGNVLSIAGRTDAVIDQVECFRYDYVRRLVRAWTQDVDGCGTPQATGADAYHRSWTFDAVGNRLTQTDHDPLVGATTWTYQVGASSGVTAHQVARVDATGPKAGAASRLFEYDAGGNMTTRTTDSGAVQALAWYADGRLASVTEGTDATSYVYDGDGDRLIARTLDGDVLYLGATEVEKLPGGGVVATRYYQGVAVRGAAGLRWLAADHNGTTLVQIDADTLQPERRRMMPYGEVRGSQPAWVGTKGYVGGTSDDTGLTHLAAREYDPTLGRFLSVDPLMNAADPQQRHSYSYANNSPVTWSDPSGLIPNPGSVDAHATAVYLRYMDLVDRYGLGARITVSPRTERGADIVCWNCDALATGGKRDRVFVWEVKPDNYPREQALEAARKSLHAGIAWAEVRPEANGREAIAGPMFDAPNSAHFIDKEGNQRILVVESVEDGVELYRVYKTKRKKGFHSGKPVPQPLSAEEVASTAGDAPKNSSLPRQKKQKLRRLVGDPVKKVAPKVTSPKQRAPKAAGRSTTPRSAPIMRPARTKVPMSSGFRTGLGGRHMHFF
jgi:RHS repeat-associated protein